MPVPQITGGSVVYPALIPPLRPDFIVCSPFYGTELIEDECRRAAGLLPHGSAPTQYDVIPGSGAATGDLNSLPHSVSYG